MISTLEFLIEKDNSKFMKFENSHNYLLNRANSQGQRPLYLACKNGHLEIVKFLISKRTMINLHNLNDTQSTPLSIAVKEHRIQIIKLLLSKHRYQRTEILRLKQTTKNSDILRILDRSLPGKNGRKSCLHKLLACLFR